MGGKIKIVVVLITTILVISGLVIIFYPEERRPIEESIVIDDDYTNEDLDDNGDENGDNNGNDNGGDIDFSHYVFIEETTDVNCEPCVDVGHYLHEIYESGKYPFYYISLVWLDGGRKTATDYVENHYNTFANPTVYIDGGSKVLIGKKEKAEYEKEIKSALSRSRPSININLSAEWDENQSKIKIEGNIKNDDVSTYNGFLRVYLAEIISTQLQNRHEEPYHFAFMDFIIEKRDVNILASDNYNFSETIDDTNLDPDNLMVYAAVFNSQTHERYSFSGNTNKFNAHFADNVDATEVVEGGNLPPIVSISIPEAGKLHIGGNPKGDYIKNNKNTYIVGKLTVKAEAVDDSGIEIVKFYLDDDLISSAEEEPYEFTIKKAGIFRIPLPIKHTITVTAFDTEEKSNSVSMDIITFLF